VIQISNFKVLTTGLFAWLLFSFGSLKLSVIYAPNSLLAYIIIYNITGILFLLYFYSYLRSKFDFKMFLILVILFNISMHLFEYTYQELLIIHRAATNNALIIFSVSTNLVLMVICYAILRRILKFRPT